MATIPAPTGLRIVSVTDSSVWITWAHSWDHGDGARGFIFYRDGVQANYTNEWDQREASVGTDDLGGTLLGGAVIGEIGIKAVGDDGGTPIYSDVVTITSTARTLPAAPVKDVYNALCAVPGACSPSCRVFWGNDYNDPTVTITLGSDVGGLIASGLNSGNNYDVKPLRESTAYTFYVYAVSADGTVSATQELDPYTTIAADNTPLDPFDLQEYYVTSTGFLMQWKVTTCGGEGPDSFELTLINDDQTLTGTVYPPTLEYQFTGVNPNMENIVTVRAKNAKGDSGAATKGVVTLPDAPESIGIDSSGDTNLLYFEDDNPDDTEYVVITPLETLNAADRDAALALVLRTPGAVASFLIVVTAVGKEADEATGHGYAAFEDSELFYPPNGDAYPVLPAEAMEMLTNPVPAKAGAGGLVMPYTSFLHLYNNLGRRCLNLIEDGNKNNLVYEQGGLLKSIQTEAELAVDPGYGEIVLVEMSEIELSMHDVDIQMTDYENELDDVTYAEENTPGGTTDALSIKDLEIQVT